VIKLLLLGSNLTGCLSAEGSTNHQREHQLIRFNHKNDDRSRAIIKKFFLPYPVQDDIDAQPIWKGICIENAMDGKHKSYLCPSRVSLADKTPTTEVILQDRLYLNSMLLFLSRLSCEAIII
jgi:hypothetical protein